MNTKVSIIGAGSWGTANAVHLAKKGVEVKMWVRKPEMKAEMEQLRENRTYLPEIRLPESLKLTNDLEEACKGADIIVLGTPSHIIREISSKIQSIVQNKQVIVSLAKGIENDTLLRMSQVIAEFLPNNPIVVLSGPSHAEELGRDMPTTVVSSSMSKRAAEYVQEVFMSNVLRIYTNGDLAGVELGGALKNIIALGAGVIDGLGYGDNAKAALMTRGMVEMGRLGVSMGADRETFAGLAGIGDLIVTCTSMHSRNRRAGIAIGQGKTIEEITAGTKMVVEGVRTTKSAYELAKKQGVEMPITNAIYEVIYNHADVAKVAAQLMGRNKKHEMEDLNRRTDFKEP